MGPRTSIRGNAESTLRPRQIDALQWGRGLPSAETTPGSSANSHGHRTLQWGRGLPSAETSIPMLRVSSESVLQWGRGLPSAETPPREGYGASHPASMGPRTSIRGNQLQRDRERRLGAASMGPRTSIRGNWLVVDDMRLVIVASMGPRTSIRGNTVLRVPLNDRNRLQWGRGLPSAETQERRGHRVNLRQASMGPRTSIRGNESGQYHPFARTLLQWGRGLPSAETMSKISSPES